MRLITIPFSHYCEKARWALDYAGVAFAEEGHVPLFHWRASLGAGGGRTVPVLVSDEGVLRDSTDILRLADRRATPERRLYPPELEREVAALEDRFDVELGPHTRRLGYYYALPNRALTLRLASAHVPAWESQLLRVGFPLARAIMKRGLRISDDGASRSLAKVEQIFGEVDALLADGRRFLVGDRFTAADLTFASLAAPLLAPPGHPRPVPVDEAPAALRALRDRLRATTAGQHALRVYREHRQ